MTEVVGQAPLGGIDVQFLSALGTGEFVSKSGEPMMYHNSERSITIATMDNTINELSATIDDDGWLVLELYTKGYQGDPSRKHPDLFAGKFTEQALAIFRDRNLAVRGIKSEWLVSGAHASEDARRYLINKATGQSPEEAALHTWNGEIATRCGFGKVTSVTEELNQAGAVSIINITYEPELQ